MSVLKQLKADILTEREQKLEKLDQAIIRMAKTMGCDEAVYGFMYGRGTPNTPFRAQAMNVLATNAFLAGPGTQFTEDAELVRNAMRDLVEHGVIYPESEEA